MSYYKSQWYSTVKYWIKSCKTWSIYQQYDVEHHLTYSGLSPLTFWMRELFQDTFKKNICFEFCFLIVSPEKSLCFSCTFQWQNFWIDSSHVLLKFNVTIQKAGWLTPVISSLSIYIITMISKTNTNLDKTYKQTL